MTSVPSSDANSSGDEELVLSPSEQAAHNAALRFAGAGKGHVEAKTQRALASITLGFELIIVVLVGLTIFGLSLLHPRELGLVMAGVLALMCILALVTMRFGNIGIFIGWVVHALMLATTFILPAAGIVALMFTGLYVFSNIKGARIDRDRAEYFAAQSHS